MTFRIKKQLTTNDTGENGSHQAGLHVPRKEEFLSFFPSLNNVIKNPFEWIVMKDDSGKNWKFKFIYYNNKLTSNGTRNEYRLTCMTPFFKNRKVKAGNIIVFEKMNNDYFVFVQEKNLQIISDDIWEVEFI